MVNEVAAGSEATCARTSEAAAATYAQDDLLPAASLTDASTVPPPVHDPTAFAGAAAVDEPEGALDAELDGDALDDDEGVDGGLVLDEDDGEDDWDEDDVEDADDGADADDADGVPPGVGAEVELIGATVGASATGWDVCEPRVTTHAAAKAIAANAMTRTGASQCGRVRSERRVAAVDADARAAERSRRVVARRAGSPSCVPKPHRSCSRASTSGTSSPRWSTCHASKSCWSLIGSLPLSCWRGTVQDMAACAPRLARRRHARTSHPRYAPFDAGAAASGCARHP